MKTIADTFDDKYIGYKCECSKELSIEKVREIMELPEPRKKKEISTQNVFSSQRKNLLYFNSLYFYFFSYTKITKFILV